MEKNVLSIKNRKDFRDWLSAHHDKETECYVELKRGKPEKDDVFYYLDAVEEALCFGWIDSTLKELDGRKMQRFSPRKRNSPWTELNKERVRRLERLGLMTDAGRAVLPPMGPRSFRIDSDIESTLKKARAWSKFKSFPPLYQRVRAYNIAFYKKQDPEQFKRSLNRLIKETKEGKSYGEWNDYGRLPADNIPCINYVHEPDDLQCGQAVLAMLTGKPVLQVSSELNNSRETTLKEMKEYIKAHGLAISDKRCQAESRYDLPSLCLLSLETPRCWHWSLYCSGVFFDPEHNILYDFPESNRKFYWEINI